MQNLSAFGVSVNIVALQSFPFGMTITKFAEDKDPIKVDEIETTGFEMLIDGSLFAFDKAAPVKVAISVMAGTEDDLNLKVLLQARKGTSSIIPLPDTTSMVISYPGGGKVAFSNGSILSGPLSDSVVQAGKLQGNTYTFIFGSFNGAQSFGELAISVARAVASIF